MYQDNSTNNRHAGPAPASPADDRTERIAPAYSVIGEWSGAPGHGQAPAPSGSVPAPAATQPRFERDANGSLHYVEPVHKPEATKYDSMSLNAGRPRPDGSIEEPRWPMLFAFTIDLLLHAAIGAAVWLTITKYSPNPQQAIPLAVTTAVAISFAHRTVIQRITGTTLGKAFFDLRLRYPDGTFPTLWQLTKLWFIGAFTVVVTPLQLFG
ncbi:RDD family protein [Nocardia vinacea]|uniref:RDD family protein n=1 Tax=Nocardia vinacea TaxID=96468 RepID=UPI0033CC21C6